MLHPESIPGKNHFFLCKKGDCKIRVSKILLKNFQLIMREKYDNHYQDYFRNGEILNYYYYMPDSTADTGE